MSPTPSSVLSQLERIENEMKHIGMWQEGPLAPEQFDFRAAFGMDTMSFAQWLQFIFIPNVRTAAGQNKFPAGSNVAAQAVREFDGNPEASQLIMLLSDFDALF
ncbi:MAG TPA: YqcC family protein [Anaerolineales bacterium]|nr:YqcC family protein [Anaerolineales bacterium]